MPKYRITAPDGASYEITAPEGASEQQVLSFAQSQFGGSKPAAPAAPPSNVTAPATGLAMGFRDPIDAGAQLLRRVAGDKVGGAIDTFGNWLASKGLPVAPSQGVQGVDKIVQDVNQQYEQRRTAAAGGEDPGFDGKRLVGNLANPVNYLGGGGVAAARTLPQLAIAGAKAGAVSGALQPVTEGAGENFWEQKAGQTTAGAVSGAVATPLVAKGTEKIAGAVNRAMPPRPQMVPSAQNIRIQTNNILQAEGIAPAEAPQAILDSVRRQVDEALRAGRRLNPQEMVRRARFEAVGLTGDAAPTAGQLSRNPTQYANEVNLSQVRITNPQGIEGNPLADRFNAQNRRLQDVFNQAGARDATDAVTAGNTIMGGLRDADAPARAGVDELYQTARGMNEGRAWDLERGLFSQNANRALDEGMWGAFVPPEVRTLLNSISDGTTPFNVDAAVQIDTLLSKAQRKAERAGDDAGASAVGVIRNALHSTPLAGAARETGESAAAAAARTVDDVSAPGPRDVPFREIRPDALPGQPALPAPPGSALATQQGGPVGPVLPQPPGAGPAMNAGEQARAAFDQARRAARDRFATIEAAPALRAALDEDAPDKFVQHYILGANAQDVQAMRRLLENSPEALGQARAQVAAHLRRAAFGENASGDKAFTPERYERVLRAIGPQKLQAFFSPDEIMRFNLAGQVASDINSVPAGAKPNFSGTGGALFNLLSRITESPMMRRIPGVRSISNQVTEIRNEQAINQALRPAIGSEQPRQLSPEAVRALQLLFTPAGVAGGVLGGASVNP